MMRRVSSNENVGQWLADALTRPCVKRPGSPANENAKRQHGAPYATPGNQSVDYSLGRLNARSSSAEAQARDPMALPVSSLDSPLMSCPSRLPSPLRLEEEASLAGKSNEILSPTMLYEIASDVEWFDLPARATGSSDIALLPPGGPASSGDSLLGVGIERGGSARSVLAELQHLGGPAIGWNHRGQAAAARAQALGEGEMSEAVLRRHARWQESLRAALCHADGYTRSLLQSAATAFNPCGSLQELARLSPRQGLPSRVEPPQPPQALAHAWLAPLEGLRPRMPCPHSCDAAPAGAGDRAADALTGVAH